MENAVSTKGWTVNHFSQANPRGPDQGDVPALLRRVADSLELLGAVEVQDVAFHTEMTGEGPWHSMTVYYYPSGSSDRSVDSPTKDKPADA